MQTSLSSPFRMTLAALVAMALACAPGAAPEQGGPSLVSTLPSRDAAGVAQATPLTLTFSAPIDPGSLAVALTPSANLGAPAVSEDGVEVSYPVLSLALGTRYTVSVSAADLEGRPLSGESAFSFTTTSQADTTPPALVASTPAEDSMGVSTSVVLALTFSEPMDPASLVVVLSPEVDLGAPEFSKGDTEVRFPATPAALEPGKLYGVQLQGADKAGNGVKAKFSFTTAVPPDAIAPAVVGGAPEAGAVNVPTNAALSLSFSEPMNKASVEAALTIVPAVAGTKTWDAAGTLLTLTPAAPLQGSTQYTVQLAGTAADLAGNLLAAKHASDFTTAATADVVPPTVASSTPASGAVGVLATANLVVEFSEPMDKATTQASFAITSHPAMNQGTFSWSKDGRTMTFNPQAAFPWGAAVTWAVSTSAKDLAGNLLGAVKSGGFMVRRRGVVVVDASASLDGYLASTNFTSVNGLLLFAGDNAGGGSYRSYLDFSLAGLPEDTLLISDASVHVFQSAFEGAPTASLGGRPRLQAVHYSKSLEFSDWDTPTLSCPNNDVALGGALVDTVGWKSAAVLGAVLDAWGNRAVRGKMAQFQLQFPVDAAPNGTADLNSYHSGNTGLASCNRLHPEASGGSCKPYLVVVYQYP